MIGPRNLVTVLGIFLLNENEILFRLAKTIKRKQPLIQSESLTAFSLFSFSSTITLATKLRHHHVLF